MIDWKLCSKKKWLKAVLPRDLIESCLVMRFDWKLFSRKHSLNAPFLWELVEQMSSLCCNENNCAVYCVMSCVLVRTAFIDLFLISGQNQMSLGNPVVNSLYGVGGNHFPSSVPSSSTSSSIPVSSHRSPDGSTLMSYQLAGTSISGTAAERSDAVLDGYMLGGSMGGVIGGPGGLMPPSSTADQMIRSYHCRLCKQVICHDLVCHSTFNLI